jgi:glucokinase
MTNPASAEWVVALDVGGTRLRAARFDRALGLHARAARPTPARAGAEAMLATIDHAVAAVWPDDGHVVAIGISAPGPLDPHSGVILRCQNIAGWDDYPLRDVVSARFGVPAILGDDANLAALAEQRLGAGRGRCSLVYLTISTGVGSGIIIENQLLLGAHGIAAEAGCMIIEPDGPLCSSGSHRGCLEALISGPALAREAVRRIRAGEPSRILELTGEDLAAVTAEMITRAAQDGDALAVDVLRQAGIYLGIGLINLLHILDPEVVVIGGGVSAAGELLLGSARETVRRGCLTDRYWRDVPIVLAELGDDASLAGAACLAWDVLG